MEALHEAFMPTNLVFTILLMMIVLYWLMVILGALDTDFLDIEFDTFKITSCDDVNNT